MEQEKEYLKYRQEWESLPKTKIVSRVPLHLDIETTTRCNLQCEMCMFHSPKALYKPDTLEDMDFQLYKKIIDEISSKGTKSIKLNYRGEPLLYKYLPEAIRYAKDKGILEVWLNSNGTLLTEALITRLIYSKLDRIILTDYNILNQYTNIKRLFELRNEMGFERPLIVVQTDVNRNWSDVCDKVEKPIFYDYNTPIENINRNEFECEQPWLRFVVLVDGTVLSCSCGLVIVDKILGNVVNFDIETLWNSIRMKFIRCCFEGHRSDLIRSCRMCPYRNDIRGVNNNKL